MNAERLEYPADCSSSVIQLMGYPHKINARGRGMDQVGEMNDLSVQAFTRTEVRARFLKEAPALLLLDEAEVLASSHGTQVMHLHPLLDQRTRM